VRNVNVQPGTGPGARASDGVEQYRTSGR